TILGVLLGGRLGYILFYNLGFYLENPLKIFAIWEGGMSFHGGLLGVTIALLLFVHFKKINLWRVSDAITGFVPLGVMFVRIGNFINGELYGRIADKFCIYFPTDPSNCRYPSQLLQAFLEGLILFLILQFIAYKNPKQGIVSCLFLILYGLFRIIAEFFRQPDPQIGFLWDGITQGQLLSVLMVIAGIILLFATKTWKKDSGKI
ncbi:prolipoprotein diacylglyceryl transferase, partial [Patescibacteria group bacterium]|nr:prolipoprotein diacylglyceryl transferase [Patescibacteria group bacterium]